MGLIKAFSGALGGTLADQWREFFYCDSLSADTLVAKGQKRVSGRRSSNKKGEENIISNGALIAVNEGQCMIIVEQGKVVELCAEAGEFKYDSSTEPSVFYGGLGEGIKESFKTIGKRFTFGGDTAKDQRVYYFNTKEIMGNKYGTPSPVPFRVVDANVGLDVDISIRCHGEYSYKITNPILFYTNVCGNVASIYDRAEIDSQLRTEFMTALQPAFAKISAMGVRYSALPGHTEEVAEALNEVLSEKWSEARGISVCSIGINSVKASEEDEAMIKELQRNAAYRNPTMAAATLVGAQAQAMQDAAKNANGAMMGFAGFNMAMGAGGMNAQNLYAMGAQQQSAPAKSENTWKCACGAENTGRFCTECGAKKPEPKAAWKCSCGAENTGRFCTECGAKKPEASRGWTCSCGKVNMGKFCMECGAKKPAGAPLYRCDKCGWEPADPKNPPKFCMECGDPFTDDDIKYFRGNDMNETENTGENFSEEVEETLEQTDKKCPQCGGTLDFDPKTGELVCTYCGATVNIEDEEEVRAQELDFLEAENKANRDWGAETRTVICKNCGAETVYDAGTVSGECPYCGSNQVMEAGGEDTIAPGGVCPFCVTEQSAGEHFAAWLKGKLFCPRAAKKAAKAGKMNGVYLPFWTFDTDTYSDYTARYGKEHRVRRGKETKVVIKWYHTRGSYRRFIDDELVCASVKHDKKTLSQIEPFDTGNNLEYKPEYLAGFASERYSVGLQDAWTEAKRDIQQSLESDVYAKVRREHHTNHVDSVRLHTSYRSVTYKYLLLPVWMSSYTYKGKLYRFMVNGRTGKVGGKYPVSPLRVAIAAGLGIAAVLLLAYVFMSGDGEATVYIQNAESYLALTV